MAVLPPSPDLSVEILVNGTPLQEYTDEDEDQASHFTVTKYIEAQSGAEFSVRYFASHVMPMMGFTITVYLDGQEAYGVMSLPGRDYHTREYLIHGRRSAIGSQSILQRFKFRELPVVEGNTHRMNKDLLDRLASSGTIEVVFQRAFDIHEISHRNKPLKLTGMDVVPEKAFKGQTKTHEAILSNPEKAEDTALYDAEDDPSGPFATFKFKYRSRAALQALGVIPRDPTPVPLEERPEDELTRGELRQLVKHLKEKDKEATALKVKKENIAKRKRATSIDDNSDATDDIEVVRERNEKRSRQQHDEMGKLPLRIKNCSKGSSLHDEDEVKGG